MHVRDINIPMKTQIVVSLADLRYLSIECPHCGTRVILDMKPESEFGKRHGFSSPRECPGCHKEYDSAIQQNAEAFQKAYERLSPQAKRISFQGTVTEKGE